MDVLEYIENNKMFMRDLIRALHSGGKVLITVPAKKILWSQHDEIAHHYRRYELDEFKNLWAGLNVKPICLSYFNSRLYPLIRLVRFLGNRLKLTWGKNKTNFALPPMFINRFLIAIFAGEAKRILKVMMTNAAKPYAVGASIIAVLEKADNVIDTELN